MVEHPRRPRFLLESAQRLGIIDQRPREDFDRHVAGEARVLRAIDLAHPAGADGGNDFVGAERRTGGEHARTLLEERGC